MQYAVIYEQTTESVGAWVPDLPGCIAVGATLEEVQHLIREAIDLHLAGMREDGLPIPMPRVKNGRTERRHDSP